MRTSNWAITESVEGNYLRACREASLSELEFARFKKNSSYQVILEHLSREDGEYYLSCIGDSEILSSNLKAFSENDLYGGADVQEYAGVSLSPSTIKYIKNSLDILSLVGEGVHLGRIVEIGGGYGGLAKTLSVVLDFDEYISIDQPEANLLSEKYISKFPELSAKFKTHSCYEYPKIDVVDLVISNYALSELDLESQYEYCDNIIVNSKFIYVTYNLIIADHIKSLQQRIGESYLWEIEPERDHGNKILYGKRNG